MRVRGKQSIRASVTFLVPPPRFYSPRFNVDHASPHVIGVCFSTANILVLGQAEVLPEVQ